MVRPARTAIPYEPAIDGLRAIAVLAVLVFHLDPRWLPGGFTGVDIFFVISGYLITRILLGEFDAGTFSLGRFLYRRIARIIPALAFVGLATLLAASKIYSAMFIGSAAANLVAAIGSFANIKLFLQGNYFEASPLTQPFLHCWSLSLEEQFYCVFPVLLHTAWARSRRAVVALLVAVFTVSLVACIAMTPRMPTAAFYMLPFRAWELLAGSLLAAWVWITPRFQRPTWASWSRLVGTVGIGGSIVAIDEQSGFPGWVALIPVLSTVAVIAALVLDSERGAWRWMVSKPLVGIGKVSYALYLTHWPVCALVDYALCEGDPWFRLALKLALIAAFTFALHVVVEVPSRRRLLDNSTWRWELVLLVASLALVLPIAFNIKSKYFNHRRLTHDDIRRGGVVIEPNARHGSVMLIGDSHGAQHAFSVAEVCGRRDVRFRLLTQWGTQIIPTPDVAEPPLLAESLRWIGEDHADVVILGCDWVRWLGPDNHDAAALAIERIAKQTKLLVILTTQPCLPIDRMQEAVARGLRPPYREKADEAVKRAGIDEWLKGLSRPGIAVVDVGSCLVTPGGELRLFDERGRFTFEDRRHVNEFGGALIIARIEPLIVATAPTRSAGGRAGSPTGVGGGEPIP